MASYIFIAFIAIIVFYGVVRRPGIALAYALVAQQLNSTLFEDANLFPLRYGLPILGLAGVHVLHFRRQQLQANIHNLFNCSILQAFLIFSAYVVVYTISIGTPFEIGYLKRFIFPGMTMFLIGALMVYRHEMLKEFVQGFVIFTALTLLYVQLAGEGLGYDLNEAGRVFLAQETGIGAIAQGRMAGSLALVCILMALMKRNEWAASIMLVVFGFAIVWMSMVGTRGALVALLSALLLYLVVSRSKSRTARRLAIFTFFLTPVLIASGITDALLVERTQELFQPGELESMKRFERLYVFAETVFDHIVIGYGPGGWSKYIWEGVNPRPYPHNLLIEVQLEYGIVGSMLILFMIFSGVRMAIKICSDTGSSQHLKVLSVLWVYYIVSTLFSGSLIQGNAQLFALTGTFGAGFFWHVVDRKVRCARQAAMEEQVLATAWPLENTLAIKKGRGL